MLAAKPQRGDKKELPCITQRSPKNMFLMKKLFFLFFCKIRQIFIKPKLFQTKFKIYLKFISKLIFNMFRRRADIRSKPHIEPQAMVWGILVHMNNGVEDVS